MFMFGKFKTTECQAKSHLQLNADYAYDAISVCLGRYSLMAHESLVRIRVITFSFSSVYFISVYAATGQQPNKKKVIGPNFASTHSPNGVKDSGLQPGIRFWYGCQQLEDEVMVLLMGGHTGVIVQVE